MRKVGVVPTIHSDQEKIISWRCLDQVGKPDWAHLAFEACDTVLCSLDRVQDFFSRLFVFRPEDRLECRLFVESGSTVCV